MAVALGRIFDANRRSPTDHVSTPLTGRGVHGLRVFGPGPGPSTLTALASYAFEPISAAIGAPDTARLRSIGDATLAWGLDTGGFVVQ